MLHYSNRAIIPAAIALACAAPTQAQEAMYTAAATMPSPHTGIIRTQFHLYRFGSNPQTGTKSTDILEARAGFSYGIVRDWAAYIEAPLQVRSAEDRDGFKSSDHGVENIDLMAKWRFYKNDSGGINTLRAALMLGASIPSGDDDDFSSNSVNPHAGVVLTWVRGRHGANQEFHLYWNTGGHEADNFGGEGPSEAVRSNSAYVYRIDPARYTSESVGAWYVTGEVNILYETNADLDIRLSPGLMYEGREFAFEVMGQIPVYQDTDHRPDFVFAVGFGFRFSF